MVEGRRIAIRGGSHAPVAREMQYDVPGPRGALPTHVTCYSVWRRQSEEHRRGVAAEYWTRNQDRSLALPKRGFSIVMLMAAAGSQSRMSTGTIIGVAIVANPLLCGLPGLILVVSFGRLFQAGENQN